MGAQLTVANQQTGWSLAPRTMEEAFKFAELVARSDLAPKDYKGKPANVILAIQMGSELGLSPMQALSNISVINGRASVWGDAMLALCMNHPSFEDCQETDDGNTATCTVLRKGRKPVVGTFSMEEARQAGLANKDIWRSYPKRMRKMRARAFALRDAFADVLRGLSMAEEVQDIPVSGRATVVDAPPRDAVQSAPALPEHAEEPPAPPPIQSAGPLPSHNPAVDDAPYVFKSGRHEGKSIRDVPTEYLQELMKASRGAALRNRCSAELARRDTHEYITEQMERSIAALNNDPAMDLSDADPAGLAGDAHNEDGEPV